MNCMDVMLWPRLYMEVNAGREPSPLKLPPPCKVQKVIKEQSIFKDEHATDTTERADSAQDDRARRKEKNCPHSDR